VCRCVGARQSATGCRCPGQVQRSSARQEGPARWNCRMPSTMLSPGTPPHLPSVPGVVFVLARTGAYSPCRGFPAVVLEGVAFEVPGVRDVAWAGGGAESPHVDELVADRAVALHDQIVRLGLRARHPFSIKETAVVVRTTETVLRSMPYAVRFGRRLRQAHRTADRAELDRSAGARSPSAPPPGPVQPQGRSVQ